MIYTPRNRARCQHLPLLKAAMNACKLSLLGGIAGDESIESGELRIHDLCCFSVGLKELNTARILETAETGLHVDVQLEQLPFPAYHAVNVVFPLKGRSQETDLEQHRR